MLCHVVLFRPRSAMTAADRSLLADAFEVARRDIPSVRTFRVGRRTRLGGSYDATMDEHFPYAAIVEFEDAAGLQQYLQHPAHEALGTLFGRLAEAALIYDFEMLDSVTDIRQMADTDG